MTQAMNDRDIRTDRMRIFMTRTLILSRRFFPLRLRVSYLSILISAVSIREAR